MIEAIGLSKKYGDKVAVDNVSFTVQPGMVTGFLGPNGAGKSTTMRMIVGLDRPTTGSVTVNGKQFAQHSAPLRVAGALLEAKGVHTGRNAYNHLLAMAATHGIPTSRVDEVISMTGLDAVAGKRVGGFSLGMGQRLGIAAALLADPAALVLDEPVNGLDPEGVLWVRQLLRSLAREGRTVLLSSHLMSEMAVTADHLIVLGKGRIIADASMSSILAGTANTRVRVRTPQAEAMINILRGPDVTVTLTTETDVIEVIGVPASRIGEIAAAEGIIFHELSSVGASLEEAYMSLTQNVTEFNTSAITGTANKENS
ncbi:MAG: ATP-binding cassette domain-containing protein [Homoserinimonas sp.]